MTKRFILGTLLAAATALGILGCTSGAAPQAPNFNPATSQHPADWTQNHWSTYLQNPASCVPCHGSTTDATQAGGTSGVSCFGCHHPNGPHHPSNWADPEQHGRLGAQAAVNGQFGFVGTGFTACTQCHGSNYTNPLGIPPSCEECHTTAPHPPKPWSNSSSAQPTHDQTDPSNAAACAQCHLGGANSDIKPKLAPLPNAAPGCSNSTLCHDPGNPL